MLDVIGTDCCIIWHWGIIWCVRDFFQWFFSLLAKHIVCTASTTTNEISSEFVTVFSMNFRKIFGNVQKHLLQYIFCQIRIAHNFVSGMVDQPFVGIIYIYKLFFAAPVIQNCQIHCQHFRSHPSYREELCQFDTIPLCPFR